MYLSRFYLIRWRKEGQMLIIKKKKLKKLKTYRRACQRIYDLMIGAPDDEHGNASPYRWDQTHKAILEVLEEVGYGKSCSKVIPMAGLFNDTQDDLDNLKIGFKS